MSGIGTGYDLSTTTYSPDGKVFQVEYACKAVENGGLAIGCKCKDGVVVAVEKLVQSKMLVPGTNKRIHAVSKHAGMAGTGLVPDVRTVVDRAREEAANYLSFYGDAIPANVLADRMAHYYHLFTLYWSVRPFGASVILATKDSNGYHMYVLEPSGECHKMNGCAIGKNKAAAKTEFEKLKFGEILAKDCVKELARVIYKIHDEKDKDFECELGWICEDSKGEFRRVPKEVADEAIALAKAALEEDDDMDDA